MTEPGAENGERGARAGTNGGLRRLWSVRCFNHGRARLRSAYFSVALLGFAVIGIATIAVPVSASPSSIDSSHKHRDASSGRPVQVTPEDKTATRAYLEATYAYQQTLVAKTTENVLLPAFEQLAGRIGGECPATLAGAPQRGLIEATFSTGPSSPSSPGPARRLAEDIRAERQLFDLRYELSGSFEATAKQIERPATEAFIDAVTSLHWSDPAIAQRLAMELAELEEGLHVTVPDVGEDIRVWVSSGFETLSPATKAFVNKLEEALDRVAIVNGVPTVTQPVSALLRRYENASDRTLEAKTDRLALGSLATTR